MTSLRDLKREAGRLERRRRRAVRDCERAASLASVASSLETRCEFERQAERAADRAASIGLRQRELHARLLTLPSDPAPRCDGGPLFPEFGAP